MMIKSKNILKMKAISKDKAEEKARAIQARTERLKLISKIPLIKSNILYISESGSINGSLMLSIEKLMDNYTENLSTENAQLSDILREIVELTDKMMVSQNDFEYNIASVQRGNAITKAKKLLANTKEDEKVD